MINKNASNHVYSHSALTSNFNMQSAASVQGFSVNSLTTHIDKDLFKQHFRSDFLAMLLIKKGELHISLNLQEYTAAKNDLLIVSPNSLKQLISVKPRSVVSVISFTSGFLGQMGVPQVLQEVLEYFSSQYSPVWHLAEDDVELFDRHSTHLEERVRNLEIHPFGKELLIHSFLIFLYEMATVSRQYARQIHTQLSRKELLLVQFTGLVQQHFRQHRSVQHYARQLNITPKYLTETIKEVSGKTAGEIIDDYVLLEAKLYLENPDFNIAQIADALNFNDQSFFGKFFKRLTGVSPKEYRQVNDTKRNHKD